MSLEWRNPPKEIVALFDCFRDITREPGHREFKEKILSFIRMIQPFEHQTEIFFNKLNNKSIEYIFELLGYKNLNPKNLATFKTITTPAPVSSVALYQFIQKMPECYQVEIIQYEPISQMIKVLDLMGVYAQVYYDERNSIFYIFTANPQKIREIFQLNEQEIAQKMPQKWDWNKNVSNAMFEAIMAVKSSYYSSGRQDKIRKLLELKNNYDLGSENKDNIVEQFMTEASRARDGSGNVDTNSSQAFFRKLDEQAKKSIALMFGNNSQIKSYENYKLLQQTFHDMPVMELKDRLISQKRNVNVDLDNRNIQKELFDAMGKSIINSYSFINPKFKNLEAIQQNFGRSCVLNDKEKILEYLEKYLLLAAQPRGLFFSADIAKTRTCRLFFENLSSQGKDLVFNLLGYPDAIKDFETFAKILKERYQDTDKISAYDNRPR